MNQILDEIEKIPISKKTFSRLSFVNSIVSTLLILYFINQIPTIVKANKLFITPTVIYAIVLSSLLGVIFTTISFVKKEPSTILKWIGGILNISIFIFLVGCVILY